MEVGLLGVTARIGWMDVGLVDVMVWIGRIDVGLLDGVWTAGCQARLHGLVSSPTARLSGWADVRWTSLGSDSSPPASVSPQIIQRLSNTTVSPHIIQRHQFFSTTAISRATSIPTPAQLNVRRRAHKSPGNQPYYNQEKKKKKKNAEV